MPDRIITSDPVSEYRTSINELFASGTLASRPAAATVPGGRYLDEFGTEWRSDGTNWLAIGGQMPFCAVSQSGTESVPNDTDTALTFQVEDADLWGMHTAFDDEISLPYKGRWLAVFESSFPAGTSGRRVASIKQVGGVSLGENEITTSAAAVLPAFALIEVTSLPFAITGTVRQVSGSAMNVRGKLRVILQSS